MNTALTVAAVLAALTGGKVPVPLCTVHPQAVQEMTLAEARETLWAAYQTHKVDGHCAGTGKKRRCWDEFFSWKDIAAAKRRDMDLREYAVGKVHPRLAIPAAQMIAAMRADGLRVGISSAYRDAWRQGIATGYKSSATGSYHGSRPELDDRGFALDLVAYSDDGRRTEQWRQNPQVWAWIDRYGSEFGIGRPYGDKDAGHIGLIRGAEYVAKRSSPAKHAKAKAHKKRRYAHAQ